MNKYALVMTGGNYHLPSVNAAINALDIHRSKIDLHFIHDWNLAPTYIENVKKANLDFEVKFINFNEKFQPVAKDYPKLFSNNFMKCTYTRYLYMAELTDYDAVGMIDADTILLNDITAWFDLAQGTDYMLTANYDAMDTKDYKEGKGATPIWNNPIICDPKKWADTFMLMLETGEKEGIPDLTCLNHTMHRSGKMDKIFFLPNSQWMGRFMSAYKMGKKVIDGKEYFLDRDGFKINVIHGKWFCPVFTEMQLSADMNETTKGFSTYNVGLVYKKYLDLNNNYKVKHDIAQRLPY